MRLITNVDEVHRRAEAVEDDNWKFRTYLKCLDWPSARLDALVHRLNAEVSATIDCTACGHCCRALELRIWEQDIQRLAGHLGMTPEAFAEAYVVDAEDPDPGERTFADRPCRFLEGNRCSVYEARPNDCRQYPHLHKPDFVHRLISVMHNASECPIVFNVIERLKAELGWRPRR